MPIFNTSKNHKNLISDKPDGSQNFKILISSSSPSLENKILKRISCRDDQDLKRGRMITKTQFYSQNRFLLRKSPNSNPSHSFHEYSEHEITKIKWLRKHSKYIAKSSNGLKTVHLPTKTSSTCLWTRNFGLTSSHIT